jgi:hypothetical protein
LVAADSDYDERDAGYDAAFEPVLSADYPSKYNPFEKDE